MSVDRPVVVQVVDEPDKITALAEVYSAMIGDGLITVEDVCVLVYRGGMTGGPAE
jgi:PII-like signaling protein